LSPEKSLVLFRVLQECLQNIGRHSNARSALVVVEELESNQVRLHVSDTGEGFVESEAVRKGGMGFASMRERVLCVNGHLEIQSKPGTGTDVTVTIPR
jgi:two-component system sensor histidine kinase UhpB